MTQTKHTPLDLLCSPTELSAVSKEYEILDALQEMYLLSLLDDNPDMKTKRREVRALLMRHRPATFMGFLEDRLDTEAAHV